MKTKYAIRLVEQMLERVPETRSGTYNKMDPTHFSQGSVQFKCSKGHDWEIRYNDVTWGVEVEILYVTKFKKVLFTEFYFTPQMLREKAEIVKKDKWFRYTFKLISDFVKNNEVVEEWSNELDQYA